MYICCIFPGLWSWMTVYLLLGFAVPFVEENFLMLALLDVTSMAYSDQVPNTAIIILCFDSVEWSCGTFSTWQSYGAQTCFCHLHCAPYRLAFFCFPHWATLNTLLFPLTTYIVHSILAVVISRRWVGMVPKLELQGSMETNIAKFVEHHQPE